MINTSEPVIKHIWAIGTHEGTNVADLIIGPELDGSYQFNMRNIRFIGIDKKRKPYRLDDFGNPYETDSAYFDEENIIEEADSFDELCDKLDERIQAHLIWSGKNPRTAICLGIR